MGDFASMVAEANALLDEPDPFETHKNWLIGEARKAALKGVNFENAISDTQKKLGNADFSIRRDAALSVKEWKDSGAQTPFWEWRRDRYGDNPKFTLPKTVAKLADDMARNPGSVDAELNNSPIKGKITDDDWELFLNAYDSVDDEQKKSYRSEEQRQAETSVLSEEYAKLNPISRTIGIGAIQGTGDIISTVVRPFSSSLADEMNRAMGKIDAARANGGENWFGRGVRGATRSLVPMGAMGAAGKTLGAGAKELTTAGKIGELLPYAGAAAIQGNQSLTSGNDAGLNGPNLYLYASSQAAAEFAFGAAMQKLGAKYKIPWLSGSEGAVLGQQAVNKGLADALKTAGLSTAAELTEEELTTFSQLLSDKISGVNPEALSPDNLASAAFDTAVQTILMTGGIHAVQQADKSAQEYFVERKTRKAWNSMPREVRDLLAKAGFTGRSQSDREAAAKWISDAISASEKAKSELDAQKSTESASEVSPLPDVPPEGLKPATATDEGEATKREYAPRDRKLDLEIKAATDEGNFQKAYELEKARPYVREVNEFGRVKARSQTREEQIRYDDLEDSISWARESGENIAFGITDQRGLKSLNDNLGRDVTDNEILPEMYRVYDEAFDRAMGKDSDKTIYGGDEGSYLTRGIDNTKAQEAHEAGEKAVQEWAKKRKVTTVKGVETTVAEISKDRDTGKSALGFRRAGIDLNALDARLKEEGLAVDDLTGKELWDILEKDMLFVKEQEKGSANEYGSETGATEPTQELDVATTEGNPEDAGGMGEQVLPEDQGPQVADAEPEVKSPPPIRMADRTPKRDLTKIEESAIIVFPDMTEADGGLLPLNNFTPKEQESLRAAGIVETAKTRTGEVYEGVQSEYLWQRRKQLQDEQSKKKSPPPIKMSERKAKPAEKKAPPPIKMSERKAAAFSDLPQKSQELFNEAFEEKDPDAMGKLLHLDNKILRAEFEKRTGTSLPKTVGGTKEVLSAWGDTANPTEKEDAKPTPKKQAAKESDIPTLPEIDVSDSKAVTASLADQRKALLNRRDEIRAEQATIRMKHAFQKGFQKGKLKKSAPKKVKERYAELSKEMEKIDDDLQGIDKVERRDNQKLELKELAERVNDTSLPRAQRLAALAMFADLASSQGYTGPGREHGINARKYIDQADAAMEAMLREKWPDATDEEIKRIRSYARQLLGMGESLDRVMTHREVDINQLRRTEMFNAYESFKRTTRQDVEQVRAMEKRISEATEPSRKDVEQFKNDLDDLRKKIQTEAEAESQRIAEEAAKARKEDRKTVQDMLDGKVDTDKNQGLPAGEYTLPPKKVVTPRNPENALSVLKKNATAKGDTRYALNGVLVDETKDGKKVAVASNTHVLLMLPYDGDAKAGVWEIDKKTGEATGEIDAQFPRYTDVIPKRPVATIEVTPEMAALINNGAVASKIGEGYGVLFRFEAGGIVAYMNASYMAKMMQALREAGYEPKQICLNESMNKDACPITIKTDNDKAFALVMPVIKKDRAEGVAYVSAYSDVAPAEKKAPPPIRMKDRNKKAEEEESIGGNALIEAIPDAIKKHFGGKRKRDGISIKTSGGLAIIKSIEDIELRRNNDGSPYLVAKDKKTDSWRPVQMDQIKKIADRIGVRHTSFDEINPGSSEGAFSYRYQPKEDVGQAENRLPRENEPSGLVFGMEDLVELTRQINSGKFPSVKTRLRKSGAMGVFSHNKETGDIQLRHDIFIGPIIKQGIVKGDVDSTISEQLQSILEAFPNLSEEDIEVRREKGNRGEIVTFYHKDPGFASEVLAHEIGHLVDWLPDTEVNMKRGNILGRLATLSRYMKSTLESIPETGDEMNNSVLVSRKQITDELKDITRWWSPFDESKAENGYIEYRFSSRELYAEAISVLLNNPSELKKRAPNFYTTFFAYLDTKPDVKDAYNKIRDEIDAGNSGSRSWQRLREGTRRGDEANKKQYKKDKLTGEDIRNAVGTMFADRFYRLNRLVEQAKRDGKVKVNPMDAIESSIYAGAEVEHYMRSIKEDVISVLEDGGVDPADLSDYMTALRAIHERGMMANPIVGDKAGAQRLIDAMNAKLGPDRMATLEKARKAFVSLRNRTVIAKMNESGVYDSEFTKMIQENEYYATFEVVDYIDGKYGRGNGGKIYRQYGTVKEISNVIGATMQTDANMMRSINWQIAKAQMVDFLSSHSPELVEKADKEWSGQSHTFIESKDPNKSLIVFLRNGKMEGYYIAKDYGDMFSPSMDSSAAKITVGALRAFANPSRVLFTGIRPGFWAANLFRDYNRSVINLKGAGYFNLLTRYLRAAKHVWGDTFGPSDRTIDEMRKGNMLISWSSMDNLDSLDTEWERQLAKYGVQEFKDKVSRPWQRWMGKFLIASEMSERVGKVAGYLYLKDNQNRFGYTDKEIAHMVRSWVGSPSFLTKGTATPITNNILLFSNAAMQGIRGNLEAWSENKVGSTAKYLAYAVAPKMMQIALAGGALLALLKHMGYDEDDEVFKWVDSMKRMYANVTDYDMTNYIVIPLGMTEKDKTVYIRIPMDENARMFGGMLYQAFGEDKASVGDAIKDATRYMGDQGPGWNPAFGVAYSTFQYLTGTNPYDDFRRREAVPQTEWKAGGMPAHKAFGKWLWNQYGGTFIYRFSGSDDQVKSDVEKFLDLPFMSDIAGRFVKVSDYGLVQKAQKAADEVSSERAKEILEIRDAVKKRMSGDRLSPSEVKTLSKNRNYARRYENSLRKRNATGKDRALSVGKTKAERKAIQDELEDVE